MSVLLVSMALAYAAQQAPQVASGALDAAEKIASGQPIPGQISKEQAQAALAKCGIRRFETSAEGLIDGKMRRTSIRLCAADTESNAEWLAKLEKSAAQVEQQPRLPDNVKTQLLADLRDEIDRVKATRPASAAAVSSAPLLANSNAAASRSAEREPPIAALPPLPVIRPAAPGTSAAAASAKLPKLAIRCRAPGDPAGGVQCRHMTTDTALVVRAADDIPAESLLRFRRGRVEAEVALASGLRKGQSMAVRVPKAICARVFRTEFAVDLVAPSASVIDTQGPFTTRC